MQSLLGQLHWKRGFQVHSVPASLNISTYSELVLSTYSALYTSQDEFLAIAAINFVEYCTALGVPARQVEIILTKCLWLKSTCGTDG